MAERDSDRVFRFVESFFARKQKWPTMREVARSLRWRQERVDDAIEGDPDGRTYTTSYFTRKDPPRGEHFVQSYGTDGHSWGASRQNGAHA